MATFTLWRRRHETPRPGSNAWGGALGLQVTRAGFGRRRYRDPRWDRPELVARMRANAAGAQAAAEARARAQVAETGRTSVVSVDSASPETLSWFIANPVRHR